MIIVLQHSKFIIWSLVLVSRFSVFFMYSFNLFVFYPAPCLPAGRRVTRTEHLFQLTSYSLTGRTGFHHLLFTQSHRLFFTQHPGPSTIHFASHFSLLILSLLNSPSLFRINFFALEYCDFDVLISISIRAAISLCLNPSIAYRLKTIR